MSQVIAAYSGGSLPCAIGIIRMSGDGTAEILDKVFTPKRGKSITDCKKATLYYGKLSDFDGETIDLCTAAFFSSPKSYTGEDMAEIFCHGSKAVVAAALDTLYALGARPAEAGEFTRRAFLSGRIDLTEAEATADLIEATSTLAAKNAAAQLSGRLSSEIEGIYNSIKGLLAHFYAVCDYTDEDIDQFEYQNAVNTLQDSLNAITALHDGYKRGKLLREGVPVAILGKPNGGKSTLFNALCGFDRAIVTGEAGTTRDVIEQTVICGGSAVRLLDTAGIRVPQGEAEAEGVRRTHQAAETVAAAICVVDGARPLTSEDFEAFTLATSADRAVLVVNKADLGASPYAEQLVREGHGFEQVFQLSAASKQIDPLVKWLSELAPPPGEMLITSARQAALLGNARDSLLHAVRSANDGMTPDAFLSDCERALREIGGILGRQASRDVEQEIFSRFCVGK